MIKLDFTKNGYEKIPEETQWSLEKYLRGYPPDPFLTAVLSDQLFEAINKSDYENQEVLPLIVKFIYNHFPQESYGSSQRVNDWLKKHVNK